MAHTIIKIKLGQQTDVQRLNVHEGATILGIDTCFNIPYLIVLVEPTNAMEVRSIECFETGQDIPATAGRTYLGSHANSHFFELHR